jgi:hypothetical protein
MRAKQVVVPRHASILHLASSIDKNWLALRHSSRSLPRGQAAWESCKTRPYTNGFLVDGIAAAIAMFP